MHSNGNKDPLFGRIYGYAVMPLETVSNVIQLNPLQNTTENISSGISGVKSSDSEVGGISDTIDKQNNDRAIYSSTNKNETIFEKSLSYVTSKNFIIVAIIAVVIIIVFIYVFSFLKKV